MVQQDKNEEEKRLAEDLTNLERNIERLVEENRVLKRNAKNDENIRTMLRNEIA